MDTDGVVGPCIRSYERWLATGADPLHNLTHHLTSTTQETEAGIRRRMEAKWAEKGGTSDDVAKSVTNSLRRSAGTNYQSLVSYALAKEFIRRGSAWFVVHSVPPKFGNSLGIRFGPAPELSNEVEQSRSVEDQEASVVVKPDLDILIRNAGWLDTSSDAESALPEPVLLLSVKTSLADRAGAAARWKTYFDLVIKPCPNMDTEGCAYQQLGISLARDPNVTIVHGIITANIYKINSDEYFQEYGELRSNQARSNTFMFDLRYTTRNESIEVMAPGWDPLTELPLWLSEWSMLHSLPT
ncbi:MAG: hypothetical protein OXI18_13640 [bacterium]|nr:hypothetical protein [bacterium]